MVRIKHLAHVYFSRELDYALILGKEFVNEEIWDGWILF